MEDRQPRGLLFEMIGDACGGAEAARWQRERAIPAALATGAYSRATPFANLRPDESRFPRKLEAFSHLTVYEIEDPDPAGVLAATRSALADGEGGARIVDRIVYRRYPRPSQGRLSGKPTTGLLVVLISPTERRRAPELRDWADFVHLHHIAAASPPGYTIITPYENALGADPLYLHLYEMDTSDPVAAFDGMTPAVCRHAGFDMGDAAFMRWAVCEPLDIWYVNVFGRCD